MSCACPKLITISHRPLHLQPQVSFVLRSPLRPSTGRTGAFGDATSSPGPLLCPTGGSALLVRLSTPILGRWTARMTAWIMGATAHTLPPRTPGALEVVSRGLCRSPARLIVHPFPQAPATYPLALNLNCKRVCHTNVPYTRHHLPRWPSQRSAP